MRKFFFMRSYYIHIGKIDFYINNLVDMRTVIITLNVISFQYLLFQIPMFVKGKFYVTFIFS